MYLKQCELLLDYGADIHARDRSGKTPILKAGEYVSAGGIKLLVSRGACLLDADKNGMGILSLAKKSVERGNSQFTSKKLDAVIATYNECLATHYELNSETGEYIRRPSEN